MSGRQIPANSSSLTKRFAWTTAARLLLLTILLGVIAFINSGDRLNINSHTTQVAATTLACAFGLSAVYAWFLKIGKYLRTLVIVQLVLDQLIWSVVVYLSGGATSGATSFYGLSCLFGAILAGFRGAAIAASAAAVCYITLVTSLAHGWLRVPPDQPAAAYLVSMDEIIYAGVVNVLVLVVVALLAGNLTERLRITGGQLLRVEEQLDLAEREAELGRLAAALAHEIRNPLGSISGSIRLLKGAHDLSVEDRQLCDIVDREAQRLNDLVTDMLNLAKRRKPELEVIDLARTAREVVNLAQASGRSAGDVSVEFEGDESVRVLADPGMARQMLWNLVRNAVQASRSGGQVQVRVERVGDEALASVSDTGVGLDDEAKEKIFDAFYTTRSKGTGIGLAVVKRISDDHGWQIDVSDTEGGGATFTLRLGPSEEQPEGSVPKRSVQPWTLFPGRSR